MKIRKAAHFWKAYNIRNLKTDVYICVDALWPPFWKFKMAAYKYKFQGISANY